ncbi:alpha/beta fold hydrolase [uncultured Winogradskyella sp.]|uniref:alpha/beta fold hydrolase n=1 Tax=uncultured Winogradskyella sp. TaxID=395353 RepID=UPI00260698C5|nr:alpha/beta hydrolase [uncultured Winogradskyella sp.]
MFVTHRNCKIHYTSTGEGPTLLLLHGFLETLNMWDDFVEELSENNHVLCIDLLGHGKTDCHGYIHSMEAMAEAVYSVIDELKIIELRCIGHSMGGYVALALAEMKPNLIKNLCLMNSTFEADDNERKILRARAAKMATENYEALVRMSFTNLFAPDSKEKFKDDFDKALAIGLKTSKQGFIAAHKGMAIRPDRFETLTSITGKKVIIIGEKDTIYNQELVLQKVEDTTIKIELFSGGHMSHIENKQELSYFLKRFSEK